MSNTSENSGRSAKVITIRLRIPALVVAVFLVIVGLVWAFVLGVMVGRGQVNDQLAHILPQNAGQMQQPASDAERSAAEIEELIRAEDLDFKENLSQKPEPPAPAQAPAPAGQARPAAQPSAEPAPASVVTPPATVATQGQRFDYLYQVASFKKLTQADDLVAKLGVRGIGTKVENTVIKNETWYRVLISFQGTEADVARIQQILKSELKINSMLQRGKKPL